MENYASIPQLNNSLVSKSPTHIIYVLQLRYYNYFPLYPKHDFNKYIPVKITPRFSSLVLYHTNVDTNQFDIYA